MLIGQVLSTLLNNERSLNIVDCTQYTSELSSTLVNNIQVSEGGSLANAQHCTLVNIVHW